MTGAPEEDVRYRIGDLVLETGPRRLHRNGERIDLSPLTFDLLLTLVASAPNLVTREALASRVWGSRRIVTQENLTQRMLMLRRQLGDDAARPRYVESVRGRGYRLIPRVARFSATNGNDAAWSPDAGSTPGRITRFARGKLGYVAVASVALAAGVALAAWRVPTLSYEAYRLYQSSEPRDPFDYPGLISSLGEIERAVALDEDFAPGWVRKAELHLALARVLERSAGEQLARADEAASRAVMLGPDLGEAHRSLAMAASYRGDWLRAAESWRRALELGVEDGYGIFLLAAGHVDAARERLEIEQARDPGDWALPMFAGAALSSLSRSDEAAKAFGRALALNAGSVGGAVEINMLLALLGRDDFDLSAFPQLPEELPGLAPVLENLGDRDAALEALRRYYASPAVARQSAAPLIRLLVAGIAADLGDPHFALTALESTLGWVATQSYVLWYPVFRDVRRLPRFREVVRDAGLAAYWREYGWPDLCGPSVGGDFGCG